ncbi:hypothetical protein BHYA_0025g00390 [Botrytis hyacinthi]|uniref:Uncharacterized protein n=1 Tax=Botrytis hyacinthi TaxID=278943 RepID=A0A4Z1GXC7_9HELO|nr:hypothetical protein BHYA_0025g00390 [Botrytis hyacinthi]
MDSAAGLLILAAKSVAPMTEPDMALRVYLGLGVDGLGLVEEEEEEEEEEDDDDDVDDVDDILRGRGNCRGRCRSLRREWRGEMRICMDSEKREGRSR